MKLDWTRLEPTESFKLGFRTLITKRFRFPDGRVEDYVTKEKENTHCIATIAITEDGKAIVARQFRPGPEKVMDEIAGGGVNPDEDYAEAAKRELLEETGYEAGSIEFLGDIYKDAYTNTMWHFYLATDCTPSEAGPAPDENEFIETTLITIDELIENGRTGKMTDTEALFLAYDRLLELKKQYQ